MARKKEIIPVPRNRYYDPKTGTLHIGPPQEKITVKEAFRRSLANIGGEQALTEWARANPGQFFALSTRLIPQEVVGKDGGAIQVEIVDPTLPQQIEEAEKEINPKKPKGKNVVH